MKIKRIVEYDLIRPQWCCHLQYLGSKAFIEEY